MSYRSKRGMSVALPADALERPKKPTPLSVSQSSTAAAATPTVPSAETQEKFKNSNESNNNPLMKTTSPQMPSFSSKGQSTWGPFSPPRNGVPTTSSPSVGTSKSIWKIPPGTLKQKPTGALPPKPARTSNPKPLVTHACSPSGDENPSIRLKSHNAGCDKPELNLPTHEVVNEAAKQPSNITTTKSDMLSTHDVDENQLHKASSNTYVSYANSAKKKTEAMQQESATHTNTVQQEGTVKTRDNKSKKSTSFKSRLPFPIPGWPEHVAFNAKDDVLTIVVSGHISPIDVLGSKNVKYVVEFNEYHQPLRKGGWVLVKFLGCLAKMGQYCPVGALTWHRVEKHLKVQIINKIREHFVIPEDHIYDTLALQRVDKCWRHYKWELKSLYFDPKNKTREQHYDRVPGGIAANDWIKLVNYWFSAKGKKLSDIGKQARAQHCQAHILGSGSIANLRADYEEEHGEKMGLIECWEKSHVREDGTVVAGTVTNDFLLDAKAKVETLKLHAPSTSRVDLEDQAFHEVLNQGEIPERPQGFGFGVKKSDVYGVRGLLRKQKYGKKAKVKSMDLDGNARYSVLNKRNEELEKMNKELSTKCDKNNKMLNTVVAQFSQILDVIRTGKATSQLFDAAQTTLQMANQEVNDDDACGDSARDEQEDGPSQ